jgi:hypothetical protein
VSGAVLWMAATTAFRFPEAQFGIIFLPFVTIPAYQMMLGIASLFCVFLFLNIIYITNVVIKLLYYLIIRNN